MVYSLILFRKSFSLLLFAVVLFNNGLKYGICSTTPTAITTATTTETTDSSTENLTNVPIKTTTNVPTTSTQPSTTTDKFSSNNENTTITTLTTTSVQTTTNNQETGSSSTQLSTTEDDLSSNTQSTTSTTFNKNSTVVTPNPTSALIVTIDVSPTTTEELILDNTSTTLYPEMESSFSNILSSQTLESTNIVLDSSMHIYSTFMTTMEPSTAMLSSASLSDTTPKISTITAQVTTEFTSGLKSSNSIQSLSSYHISSSMSDTISFTHSPDSLSTDHSTTYASSTGTDSALYPSTTTSVLYTTETPVTTFLTPSYEDATTFIFQSTGTHLSTVSPTVTSVSVRVSSSDVDSTPVTISPTTSSIVMETSTSATPSNELQRQIQDLRREIDDLNSTKSGYIIAVVILSLVVAALIALIIAYFVWKRRKNLGKSPFDLEREEAIEPVPRRERNYMDMKSFSNIGDRVSTASLGEGPDSSVTQPLKSFNIKQKDGTFIDKRKLTTILDDDSTLIATISEDNIENGATDNGSTFETSDRVNT